jgi:hypothetical protein
MYLSGNKVDNATYEWLVDNAKKATPKKQLKWLEYLNTTGHSAIVVQLLEPLLDKKS